MPLNGADHVCISRADPGWSEEFDRLAAALRSLDGEKSIEHIGSTAVPGLDAKPILDLVILVEDVEHGDVVREQLEKAGYESEGDKGIPGREAFRRTGSDVPRNAPGPWMDHHLYLACDSSEFIRVQRSFRDYLRANPGTAKTYAVLKHSLADITGEDRDAYTERKGYFIRAALAAAEAEGQPVPDAIADPIAMDDFVAVDMRAGCVITAKLLPHARRPAIVMEIDFGPLGIRKSSAQLTERYTPAHVLGLQVVAVLNFPPRQIGSLMSECLVLGLPSPSGIVLLQPDVPVPNGSRVY